MTMDPTEADREYDRRAAWLRLHERVRAGYPIGDNDSVMDAFYAELDAAAAFARREALKQAAKVSDDKAADCRIKRVVPGDLERNFHGGGMAAAEDIADAIRALLPPAPTKE
jgi:hypothetical protein